MMYLIYCLCILFSSIKLNTIILSRRRRFGSQDQMITLSCAIECSFGMCSVSDRRCPENDLCFPTVAHCAIVRMAINDGRLGSVHKLHAHGFQWLGGTQLGRWSRGAGAWATASSATEQRRRNHMAAKDWISLWIWYKSIFNHTSDEAPGTSFFHLDGVNRFSRAPGSSFSPGFRPSSIRRA
jgi:hypothetical protein